MCLRCGSADVNALLKRDLRRSGSGSAVLGRSPVPASARSLNPEYVPTLHGPLALSAERFTIEQVESGTSVAAALESKGRSVPTLGENGEGHRLEKLELSHESITPIELSLPPRTPAYRELADTNWEPSL